MRNLMLRNIKTFFRDRAAVLYSLLAVFIIIGLYVLFLGDVVSSGDDFPGKRFLLDSWIMAGMIAAGTFTTTLGGLGQIIEDNSQKVSKDFRASPLRRSTIAGGYMLGSIFIGMIMSMLTLVLAEGYILLNGGSLLPLSHVALLLPVVFLSVLTSSAMMFFAVSFVSSSNAFGGLSTVAGTLIGFVTGIYIPIGNLPPAIQTVIKLFPISHAAALMRKIFMAEPLSASFAGAPVAMQAAFEKELGVSLYMGDAAMPSWMHIAVLLSTAALFFLLSVARVARKKQ